MEIKTATQFSEFLNTPITIGNKSISNRMVMAPMAGLGHVAFRELVDQFGGFGLLFTGMCSAKAVPHENPAISTVFSWRKEELDHTVCQIFGSTPESMALAARRIEDEGFFGVDLNMGCSVAAICKKGSGAALLKTPDKALEIVERVRQSIDCPLFVKYRTGWEDSPQFAVDLGKKFEAAGVDALTFHPRVAPDRRSRPPKWEIIGQVQEAVNIPVFGNGNLFNIEDGIKMAETTKCQGLSLGRIAVARPWIFAEWTQGFTTDEDIYQTSALALTRLLRKHHNDHMALKLFKKLAPYFCANFKFAHSFLKQLMKADTMDGLENELLRLLSPAPETLLRPNINLFV